MSTPPPPPGDPQDPPASPTPSAEASPPAKADRVTQVIDLFSDVITPQGIGALLALLVLAVTWAFGGLEPVAQADDSLPVVETGEEIDAAPFTLTFTKARWADELPPLIYGWEGQRYIFVVVTATQSSGEPVPATVLMDAVRIDTPGVEHSVTNPVGFRVLDALDVRWIQPDVPTEVLLAFTQSTEFPAPTEVTVTVREQTWRQSLLDQSWDWRDEQPVAEVTLPVTEGGGSA